MFVKFKSLISRIDVHTIEIFKKSFLSLIVKVSGMVFSLFTSIMLGRILGPSGVGIIGLSNRILTILFTISIFGMGGVVLKNVAIGFHNNLKQHISNSIKSAFIINGFISLITCIVFLYLTPFLVENLFKDSDLQVPLTLFILILIPQTFSSIFSNVINGYGKVWQSNLFNESLSVILIALAVFMAYFSNISITVNLIAYFYLGSKIIVLVISFFYWRELDVLPKFNQFLGKPMFSMALPLLLVAGTSMISNSADVIMLGWLNSSTEVGLYTIAVSLAFLISFFLQVTNTALAPKLATMFANNKVSELEIMVQKVTGVLIIIALFSLVVFLMFGTQLLSLWGNEFQQAYPVLILLAIGQFFNISTGCSGIILIMCNEERLHGLISLFFVTTNLILNYLLISRFGAIGAAATTAFTIAGESLVKMYFVKKRVGVLTIPFTYLVKKKKLI